MIYKDRDKYNDSVWTYALDPIPIHLMLEKIPIHYILGTYFYHSRIEAFSFDAEEIKDLFEKEYEGRSTHDVYNYSGKYSLKTSTVGELLKASEEAIKKNAKNELIADFKTFLNYLEKNNRDSKN